MRITLNGKEKRIVEGTSLTDLIDELKLKDSPIVAEVCGKIIKPEDYAALILEDGNIVELIRFVGGG
ncbi:sulfur carrier protein ThiS [bacterium]|nr:sulfur carrier protein ThiS [bacterium]